MEPYEGFSILEEGIQKANSLWDGRLSDWYCTREAHMKYYTCAYDMCRARSPKYAEKFYDRYKEAVKDSIQREVLPCLFGKTKDDLMIEITCLWMKYKKWARFLSAILYPLDRRYNRPRDELLYEFAVRHFRNVVVMEYIEKFVDAAVSLINRDRNGEAVDRTLLKNISTFFMEVGGEKETYFKDQFEQAVLLIATRHYSQLASQWLLCNSSTEYLLKAEQCLIQEKERANQTLYQSLEDKLLKEVHRELIIETRKPLMEKLEAEKLDNTTYQELIGKCDRFII